MILCKNASGGFNRTVTTKDLCSFRKSDIMYGKQIITDKGPDMKITSLFENKQKTVFSFEVFPPKKTSPIESVYGKLEEICMLRPDFVSVTYGAGGSGGHSRTCEIASKIKNDLGVESVAHLTCVNSTRTDIDATLADFRAHHIENILALRGDYTKGVRPQCDFRYASELCAYITRQGGFDIAGACYPEGHPESKNRDADIENLKHKVNAGVDFLTTQMFFDNDMLYSFLYRLQSAGIHVPVMAGIMPITNANQVSRMVDLSNAYIPRKLLSLCDKFRGSREAMWQAGIAYATDQIIDLISNGVRGIHIYTMNKPKVAQAILRNVDDILAATNGVVGA